MGPSEDITSSNVKKGCAELGQVDVSGEYSSSIAARIDSEEQRLLADLVPSAEAHNACGTVYTDLELTAALQKLRCVLFLALKATVAAVAGVSICFLCFALSHSI